MPHLDPERLTKRNKKKTRIRGFHQAPRANRHWTNKVENENKQAIAILNHLDLNKSAEKILLRGFQILSVGLGILCICFLGVHLHSLFIRFSFLPQTQLWYHFAASVTQASIIASLGFFFFYLRNLFSASKDWYQRHAQYLREHTRLERIHQGKSLSQQSFNIQNPKSDSPPPKTLVSEDDPDWLQKAARVSVKPYARRKNVKAARQVPSPTSFWKSAQARLTAETPKTISQSLALLYLVLFFGFLAYDWNFHPMTRRLPLPHFHITVDLYWSLCGVLIHPAFQFFHYFLRESQMDLFLKAKPTAHF